MPAIARAGGIIFSGRLSGQPILVNVVSNKCFEVIPSDLAQLSGLGDELIRCWWPSIKGQSHTDCAHPVLAALAFERDM